MSAKGRKRAEAPATEVAAPRPLSSFHSVTGPGWTIYHGGGRRLFSFACEKCGVGFLRRKRSGKPQRFCSRSCAMSANMQSDVRRAQSGKTGADNAQWKGADITERSGRSRAIRAYPPGPCSRCPSPKGERHHKDGDTANNEPSNAEMLCRRCHMEVDGRLATVRVQMRELQPLGVKARHG